MVVAVAGNVDHASVVRQVRTAFSRSNFLVDTSVRPLPVRRGERARRTSTGDVVVSRPFEQVNLVLGVNGLVRTDDRRYALGVLNAALGGGTSSRLFQEVREHRGLAYSVYSYASHYADAGTFAVAVGCLPSKVTDVLAVVRGELGRLAEDGISADELRRGKGQLRGGLVLVARGLRVPDVPDRQGRAALRRAAEHRRGAPPRRRRHPRRRQHASRATCSGRGRPSPSSARSTRCPPDAPGRGSPWRPLRRPGRGRRPRSRRPTARWRTCR